MSATSSLRRRADSPWTTTSQPGISPSSTRRAAPGSSGSSRSQALSSSSQLLPSVSMSAMRSASSATEISPLESRSFAIKVAMNISSPQLPRVALIAGPTASGKSALALRLAEDANGVVINADSAQVYRDLRLVSARPDVAESARLPHRLYGTRDGALPCSAAEWAAAAKGEGEAAHAAGRLPVLVGGTGLYIRTLLDGIAPVPEIEAEIRAAVRGL